MPKQSYHSVLFAWDRVNIGNGQCTNVKLLTYVLKDPSIMHCNMLIAIPHRDILR